MPLQATTQTITRTHFTWEGDLSTSHRIEVRLGSGARLFFDSAVSHNQHGCVFTLDTAKSDLYIVLDLIHAVRAGFERTQSRAWWRREYWAGRHIWDHTWIAENVLFRLDLGSLVRPALVFGEPVRVSAASQATPRPYNDELIVWCRPAGVSGGLNEPSAVREVTVVQ